MVSTDKKTHFKTDSVTDIGDDEDSPIILGGKPKTKNPFVMLFQGGFCPPNKDIDDEDYITTSPTIKSSLRNKREENTQEEDSAIVEPLIVSPPDSPKRRTRNILSPSKNQKSETKTKGVTDEENKTSIQISQRTIKFIVEKSWGLFVCTCISAIIIAKLGIYEIMAKYISSNP